MTLNRAGKEWRMPGWIERKKRKPKFERAEFLRTAKLNHACPENCGRRVETFFLVISRWSCVKEPWFVARNTRVPPFPANLMQIAALMRNNRRYYRDGFTLNARRANYGSEICPAWAHCVHYNSVSCRHTGVETLRFFSRWTSVQLSDARYRLPIVNRRTGRNFYFKRADSNGNWFFFSLASAMVTTIYRFHYFQSFAFNTDTAHVPASTWFTLKNRSVEI